MKMSFKNLLVFVVLVLIALYGGWVVRGISTSKNSSSCFPPSSRPGIFVAVYGVEGKQLIETGP